MSAVPEPVLDWLSAQGHGAVSSTRGVSGGCIHRSLIVETAGGRTFFLKVNPNAPADMFRKEADGLTVLEVPGGPKIPDVYLQGTDFLLLEDLDPSPRHARYWPMFGRQLAAVHLQQQDQYGFEEDNYIGSTFQSNSWHETGFDFFAQERLGFQGRLASENGYLNKTDLDLIDRLMTKLPDLIPEQPASLLHGDLWSGNLISDQQGNPAMIDPAVHYGWAEADLAMTDLFGSFPAAFYSAYQEVRPLAPGYRSRYPIYNLYHLLNHLNIFGRGYLSRVRELLRQYS